MKSDTPAACGIHDVWDEKGLTPLDLSQTRGLSSPDATRPVADHRSLARPGFGESCIQLDRLPGER